MKQKVLKLMALTMVMLFSASVNAQSDLGSVLGNVLGAATGNASSSSGGDLISTLTSVFSSDKQASKNNIIGTWSYTEPAIVFTSDNFLTQAAAKLAANKLESKLQSYLTKYGIKPGTFTMTFKEDGTYTRTLNGRTSRGTWTIQDSKLMLTIAGIKTVAITTQIDGKDMQFVTDATNLLIFFKTMGAKSTNANLQTITSLMKSVKGMQAGITLHKQ